MTKLQLSRTSFPQYCGNRGKFPCAIVRDLFVLQTQSPIPSGEDCQNTQKIEAEFAIEAIYCRELVALLVYQYFRCTLLNIGNYALIEHVQVAIYRYNSVTRKGCSAFPLYVERAGWELELQGSDARVRTENCKNQDPSLRYFLL